MATNLKMRICGKLALAKHAKCWEGDEVDPSMAAPEVSRLCRVGNETTAADRIDAVMSRLESYFENPRAELVFRDKGHPLQEGPCLDHQQILCRRTAPA